MSTLKAKSEDRAQYNVALNNRDAIIAEALMILEARMTASTISMNAPQVVRDFLMLKMSELEHEVFCVLFLDAQNRLIEFEEMFRGTLTQTSVYPREVVKAALQHNAAAVIFAHNHPSGVVQQSHADETLTQHLKRALDLVDVRVLDHFIVAKTANPLSFAEKGLL